VAAADDRRLRTYCWAAHLPGGLGRPACAACGDVPVDFGSSVSTRGCPRLEYDWPGDVEYGYPNRFGVA